MGTLHDHRVTLIHVFHSVGLDFAGPFSVKATILRNSTIIKAYFVFSYVQQ